MEINSCLVTGAALLTVASCVLLSAPAVAADAGASEESGARLDEIVVTAQRREEKIQKVPITISVVTAQDAASSGVDDTENLATLVPGLNLTRFGNLASPYLRGIGTNLIEEGDENSVATYINGVYQISPNSALFSLNNIARIEVLKGPQGTLFGRNSDGGVINITTLQPTQKPGATASLGYGNYSTYEASLYATSGITKDLATDIAYYRRDQKDGWGRNLYDNTDVFRGYNWIVRNQWLWTPTDELEFTLAGDYSESRDNSRALHPAPGAFGMKNSPYLGMYTVNIDAPSFAKARGWDVSLHSSYDAGWTRLVNIAAYSYKKVIEPDDADNTPFVLETATAVTGQDNGVTEEFQLQSEPDAQILGRPLTWIGGVYYLDARSAYVPPGSITVVGPLLGPFSPLVIESSQNTTSYAGFAQVTATLLSNTHLTLGGRYTDDQRNIVGREIIGGATIIDFPRQSTSASRFTYKVTLDHQFGENFLVYLTNSTGFKSGLYTLTSPSSPAVLPETVTDYELGIKSSMLDHRLQIDGAVFHYNYGNIQANVFNLGSNFVSFINAAKARINGLDLDVKAAPINNLVLHAGLSLLDAKYTSFPGAPFYTPNPGGGLTELNSTTADGRNLADGKDMIDAPKRQVLFGATYTIPLGEAHVDLAANYSYQSSFFWDFQNTFPEPARHLLSSSVSWAPNDHYEIRFWGRNLLNHQYADQGQTSGFGFYQSPAPPRTYGVTMTAHF